MKKIQLLLFLLLAVLFSSCYTSKINYKYLSSVHRGMSPKEVVAIMGEPNFRSFNDEGETWEYRSYYSRFDEVTKVWFEDNKVVKLESFSDRYNYYPFGGSSSDEKKKKEEKEEKSSKKDTSSTKVIVTSDGQHYIKTGSLIITPDGRHETVVSDCGGVIITASGEHIFGH